MMSKFYRDVMTLTRTKTLIREQGGEYYDLYASLPAEDQEIIARAVLNLINVCHNMGAKGALELLNKLGVFIKNNNGLIVRTKNRQN